MYWPFGFRGYDVGVKFVIEVVEQLTSNTGSDNNSNDLEMVRIISASVT